MYEDYQNEAPPEQSAPEQQAGGQSMWHGRIARDAQGNRIMWQEPQNGRGGRFVQLNTSTATPQAREAVEGARARATVLDRLVPLAEDYIRLGRTTPTGGWRQRSYGREQAGDPSDIWHGLNFPVQFMDHDERSRLERLRGLEDEAVRANIQPGQAGTANSVFEQEVLRGMFPSINTLGETNQERAIAMFVRRDLERAQLNAMEQWLTQHPDLTGFVETWSREEPRLRAQREQHHRQRWGLSQGAAAGTIAGRAGTPQRPPNVPANAQWNPQTRRWVTE